MSEKKLKYFTSEVKSVDDDKRILRFIGSTEDVDRDNEVIKASGWRLKNYRKNPIVLANHSHHDLPVAKAKKVWVEDKKLMFDIEFPEPELHPQGDTMYKLYKNKYLSATSVGFIPNMEKAVFGEKKGEPSITFKEQELLEISLVTVPANPQALMTSKDITKAIKDEVVDELEIKDLESFLQAIVEEDEKEFTFEEQEKFLNDHAGITPENLEKDEKTEEKEENLQTSEKTDIKNDSEISISKEVKACEDCGVEIHLCGTCFERKESEEYFKKVYEALIDLKGE